MKNSKKIVAALLLGLLFPLVAYAQIPDPVTFTVEKAPEKVKKGESFEVTVKAAIEGNWHLYSINLPEDAGPFPTKITASNEALKIAGEVKESDPVIEYDPNFGVKLGWHSHRALFTIPLKLTKAPSSRLKVNIFYQVCNDRVCMPPKTKSIILPVKVEGITFASTEGKASANLASPVFVEKENSSPGEEIMGSSSNGTLAAAAKSSVGGGGILSFLWLAILAGFAALLTPCVFPMIPLTVSYFSKQDQSKNSSAVGQAFIFGLAIIITFTLLGALLAAWIGAAGAIEFASNPWVNLIIGIILIAFAVSLLGGFEIRLPHKFTNFLNRKSNESSGLLGITFIALTVSAVSFSCTAPFVGGVLAATAGGQWFYPIIGMIGFSAAFASPFVVFAMFPDWMESLPQSGSWMNIVKVLLGFIELAAAFKFLSNADLVWGLGLLSRPLVIAAWIAIFLLAGFYVIGVLRLKHEKKRKAIGTGRLFLAIPLFLFSFYLIPGLLGSSLGILDAWLPPKKYLI